MEDEWKIWVGAALEILLAVSLYVLLLNSFKVLIYIKIRYLRRKYNLNSHNEELSRINLDLLDLDVQNVNKTDDYGKKPLHNALSYGCTNTAKILIDRGAPVNSADSKKKNTPLHYTANNGITYPHTWVSIPPDHFMWDVVTVEQDRRTEKSADFAEIAELLLIKGADPNLKNKRGNTPIHIAAIGSGCGVWSANFISLLFKYGARVDQRNNFGNTPLSRAILCKNDPCINRLLACGADINDKSASGQIPTKPSPDFSEAIKEHWIKLHAAELPCFGNWSAEEMITSYDAFYQECLIEVDTLKNTFVEENFSLYDFIHMDLKSRCIQITNKTLKNLVNSATLEDQFPKYFVLIFGKYNEAVTRESLLETVKQMWLEMNGVQMPDTFIDNTFKISSNADMIDMIESYKKTSKSTSDNPIYTLEQGFSYSNLREISIRE